MPHKRIDIESVKRASDRVEYYKKLIDTAKAFKMGDRDSLKNALEVIREMEFTARTNVFSLIKKGLDQGDELARFNCGLMQGYQDVLTLFEDPDRFISQFEQDKMQDEAYLKEAKLYEQVSNGQ